MAKKMAVRNKNEKGDGTGFSVPNLPIDSMPVVAKILKVLFFVTLIIACLFVFKIAKKSITEQWEITDISLNNNLKQVSPSEIAKILKKPEFIYLLQADVIKLQEEIGKLDWVKQVDIRKQWPNTIEIIIEEYKPIAKINERILIDSGALVTTSNMEYFNSLPLINIHEKIEGFDYLELIEKFNIVKKGLNQSNISIEALNLSKNFSWTVNTSDELEIKIGRKLQLERIERFVRSIPFVENLKMIKTIDLRYNNGFAVSQKDTLNSISG